MPSTATVLWISPFWRLSLSLSLSLMLRPTVSRPVCLGIKHPSGLTTKFLLPSDSCGSVDVGRSLWREDRSVIYSCCWSLPAQSFSGPSPFGVATIFYCLRFETSHFVASYDSQGHAGGIRPRLHTGNIQIQSHIATDSQSVGKSWCQAPSGTHDQIFSYYYLTVTVLFLWGALSDEKTSLSFVYAAGSSQRSLSRVRVPWYSDQFLLSQIWGFPFRRLLRLAGSRWRYSTPPPHGFFLAFSRVPTFITSAEPNTNHHFQQFTLLCAYPLLR
jgi:hypothetical protein